MENIFAGLLGAEEHLQPAWEKLENLLKSYLDDASIAKVKTAALYGAKKHDGQKRASGETYFTHPLIVAQILAEERFNYDILQAALLHDVLEDTVAPDDTSQKKARIELTELFGEKITKLVDGVSKLQKVKEKSPQETQAESLRKMIFAAADDPAVVIIKLADRIHNMQTLGAFKGRRDKILRKARETMDIYAPIASNMGMFKFFFILQNLCFSYIYPWRYKVIKHRYEKILNRDKKMVERIIREINEKLEEKYIVARVEQRDRSFWNIYLRMLAQLDKEFNKKGRKEKKKYFNTATKTMTLRIITDSEDFDDCYRILGIVHNRYQPIKGKFIDYIASPQSNGYRTLRTTVITKYDELVNIHIRTKTMHLLSTNGVVAVMSQSLEELNTSKEIEKLAQSRSKWLENLKELAGISEDPLDFFNAIKDGIKVSKNDVHIYAPDGRIYDLPQGATPLDFAYAVHKDIGNCFLKALVDNQEYEIDKPLQTGQTVKITTSPDIRANNSWLDIVKTEKAKIAIKQALNKMNNHELYNSGQDLFIKTVEEFGYKYEDINADDLSHFLKDKKLSTTDFYCSIAKGELNVVSEVLELFNRKYRDFKKRFMEKVILEVSDQPLILSKVAEIIGTNNVNINDIFLIDLNNGKVELTLVLSAALEKHLDNIYPKLNEFKEINLTLRKKI